MNGATFALAESGCCKNFTQTKFLTKLARQYNALSQQKRRAQASSFSDAAICYVKDLV